VETLSDVLRMLAEIGRSSSHLRERRAQARFYERVFKQWTAVPPTQAQLDATFDLVTDLYAKVVAAKR